MTIEELKKELEITDKDIAGYFQFKSAVGYRNSSAKKRYEAGLCAFYAFVKRNTGRQKENKTCTDDEQ